MKTLNIKYMSLKIRTTLAILAINTGMILSQQLPFSNQYLVNRQFLSPAFAGVTDNFETFVDYQKNSLHFPGGPEYKSIYASGPVYGNMSLGGSVSQSSVTIFNGFSAQFDYAYHLRVSENNFIHFGLSFAYNENFVGIGNDQVQAAQNDPYILKSRNSLNYGFGLAWTFKTFQIGVVIPRLLESKLRNSETDAYLYSLPGLIRFHTSYLFDISQPLSIEPSLVIEKSSFEPLWYNVSALMRIKEITYVELHYRQGNIMGFGLGVNPSKKVLLSYSYDLSGTGIMKYSSGIHEISFGFLIGKSSEKSFQRSAFRSLPKQPYYEWIK
jgi:type IX secretion system PorP/SprF family membrane protein